MRLPSAILCCAGIVFLTACRPPGSGNAPEIAAYFSKLHSFDTLHVEIDEEAENDSATTGAIPNSLFFKTVPLAQLQEIDYLADSSQALVRGRYYFPLNDSMTAYLVDIKQFWFQHQSLLLYNTRKKAFTDRITLAEWYGGEGGQVLTGSWLFDFDNDGKKDIVRREIQHSMIPGEEEPVERMDESATLLLWKDGAFLETNLMDTALIIRRFPIKSYW